MKRKVGKTKLSVSELGVGGAQFGNLYHTMSDQQAFDIMSYWVHQGVNLFDTAPFYGFGLSELRLGEFLRQQHLQSEIVLSTKVGRLLNPIGLADDKVCRQGFYSAMAFDAQFDYSYSGIMRSFFDSQKRMHNKEADILLIHDIGQMTHPQLHDIYWQQLLNGGLRALQELKQAGDIRAFGLGVNEIEVCLQLLDICEPDCILLAGRYTLLEQSALSELFPRCIKQGVSIMAGGVYNSGILANIDSRIADKFTQPLYYNYQPAPVNIQQRVRALQQVCCAYEVSLASAALQFVLAHPVVCAALPGTASVSQAEQTMKQYRCQIPEEFWTSLKHQGLLDESAPTPMPNTYKASGTLN